MTIFENLKEIVLKKRILLSSDVLTGISFRTFKSLHKNSLALRDLNLLFITITPLCLVIIIIIIVNIRNLSQTLI